MHIKTTTRVLSHFPENLIINILLQLLCTRIRSLQTNVMHPGMSRPRTENSTPVLLHLQCKHVKKAPNAFKVDILFLHTSNQTYRPDSQLWEFSLDWMLTCFKSHKPHFLVCKRQSLIWYALFLLFWFQWKGRQVVVRNLLKGNWECLQL